MSVALKKSRLPTNPTIKHRDLPIKRGHPSDIFKFSCIGYLALIIKLGIHVFVVLLENGGHKDCAPFENIAAQRTWSENFNIIYKTGDRRGRTIFTVNPWGMLPVKEIVP